MALDRLIFNPSVYRLVYSPLVTKLKPLAKYGKHWYPFLTRRLYADDGFLFLNVGYEEDPPMGLPLVASDEPNRG